MFTEASDGAEAAAEWARRVALSDVSSETIARLECAVDDLASAYPTTSPHRLLGRVRHHLGCAGQLMEGKKTLDQHRRLLVAVGWLALLAGTCHIDLGELAAAEARIRSADDIAREADHPEISAWCLETRAWQRLIHSDFVSAAELSRGAQVLAPARSSAFTQATAQEGRASARLGDRSGTYRALRTISRLVSGMHIPDRPEHHYHYDPAKSDAYIATTLAWLGDSAAESYARHVLADRATDTVIRPRRIAMANLDLGLALVAADKSDEAAGTALDAVTSGRLVRSHYWRLAEVTTGLAERDSAGAARVRDAFRDIYGQ